MVAKYMATIDFLEKLHKSTTRNYLERVVEHNKAECAEVALHYAKDYWDGDRQFGYGGYNYDGRWCVVAEQMIDHYKLRPGDRVLDIGCGKAFLLFEFTQIIPELQVIGIDISNYALTHAKPEVKQELILADSQCLPFSNSSFDLVYSITTLHNLYNYQLRKALKEIERVARGNKHITIESYRNEHEKINLLYWQLTCRSFYTPKEWEWFFSESGYTGDYGCIYFE